MPELTINSAVHSNQPCQCVLLEAAAFALVETTSVGAGAGEPGLGACAGAGPGAATWQVGILLIDHAFVVFAALSSSWADISPEHMLDFGSDGHHKCDTRTDACLGSEPQSANKKCSAQALVWKLLALL